MILCNLIIQIADNAIKDSNSYLKSGHNGPYNHPETPVRNMSHWLITFSKCFELTGKPIYLDKIRELAKHLISENSRPFGYSFHHRMKEGKDKCNGLIGQAWTLESLAFASSLLNDNKYAEVAEDVFFQHNFNKEFGLWNRLEIEGEILSIDETFNHQLWFAACASLLNTPRKEKIKERIFRFLDTLSENLSILDNGLIYHPINKRSNHYASSLPIKSYLIKVVKLILSSLVNRDRKTGDLINDYSEKMIVKSVGYHQFNMYAFAILKESIPEHPFWKLSQAQKTVDYLISDEFKNGLNQNNYGYPYNPPGFEVPFALSVFTDLNEYQLIDISSLWINEQFRRCYNAETQMMDRNTGDSLTLTARIYELARLPNSILEKIEVSI